MPERRKVFKLEEVCLKNVGSLLQEISYRGVCQVEQEILLGRNKLDIFYNLEKIVDFYRNELFINTPSFFHDSIISEFFTTFSAIFRGENKRFSSIFMSTHRDLLASLSLPDRQLLLLKQEAVTKFVRLIASPVIKHIDVSGMEIPPALLEVVFTSMPDMTGIQTLNLGRNASCQHKTACRLSLSGKELQFLPGLKNLSVGCVNTGYFQSLSLFCPNLTSLTVFDTDIDDEAVSCLSTLRKLVSLNFDGQSECSPYGYAELLRSLPELKSLGRCDSFGEILTTLYSKWSLYHRSVGSVPKILALESVDCRGPVTGQELSYIKTYCPNLKKVGLAYNRQNGEDLDSFGHLSLLSSLPKLQVLSVLSADFYSHSLFSVVRYGDRLKTLELLNIDEMNLNSIMMVGSGCPNLERLCVSYCHYTVEQGDVSKLSEACCESAVTDSNASFKKLVSAAFVLTTPVQLPLIKYPVYFARKLKDLRVNLIYQPVEDSFIAALTTWNPMKCLEKIELINGACFTIMAVNTIVQSCPVIKTIGGISTWGRVESEELTAMQTEIRNRNLDLVIQ